VELLRVHNYGAAWSSFSGVRWVLIGAPVAIMIFIGFLVFKKTIRHPLGKAAAALILSGGVGNLLDRIRLGYVVDMFHFTFFPSYPVFNVADICIVSGTILGLIYYVWFYEQYDKEGKVHGDQTS
jgi:signal peptidase II